MRLSVVSLPVPRTFGVLSGSQNRLPLLLYSRMGSSSGATPPAAVTMRCIRASALRVACATSSTGASRSRPQMARTKLVSPLVLLGVLQHNERFSWPGNTSARLTFHGPMAHLSRFSCPSASPDWSLLHCSFHLPKPNQLFPGRGLQPQEMRLKGHYSFTLTRWNGVVCLRWSALAW